MTVGAGKYDDLCTYVREQSNAAGAIVLIIDGNKGDGFAVQADQFITENLPAMLERLAKLLRADLKAMGTKQ